MVDGTFTKSIEEAQSDTIQARATQEGQGRTPFLLLMAHAGEVIAPWWSKKRDVNLSDFWKQSDHYSGANYTLAAKLSSVPVRIEPRDPGVASHRKLADQYQYRVEAESEFGQGWGTLITKFLMDFWNQDNGAFLEVIGGGPKDGPLKGLPVGLAHLDSSRCKRTGSVEYPVLYDDIDGKLYKLHRSRVLFRSQLPSAQADMFDVGFCWLSRCINTAQSMVDVLVYKQEKLGSRPKRAIGITRGGLDPETIQEALVMADSVMDSYGMRRYSKIPFVGDATMPDADLSLIDMASLPDGFNYEDDITLGMFTIALAGAVPPRWLWPATVTGATKADAMYQHVAGLTGGPGATLKMISQMLGGPERGTVGPSDTPRFLPPQLKLEFDFQDDEQDRMSAEIGNTRAQNRERDLNSGSITLRVAREKMLETGEVSEAQFEDMELEEGRLADGSDVLTLFNSPDPFFRDVLALGIAEPLDVRNNDAEAVLEAAEGASLDCMAIAGNPANAKERDNAKRALAALKALKDLYEGEPADEVDEPVADSSTGSEQEEGGQPGAEIPEEEAEQESETTEEEPEREPETESA